MLRLRDVVSAWPSAGPRAGSWLDSAAHGRAPRVLFPGGSSALSAELLYKPAAQLMCFLWHLGASSLY